MEHSRATVPDAFVPPRINAIDAADELGRVTRVAGEGLIVRTRTREWQATRARSCLVEPQRNDLVLITRLDDGRCYVLAILEREDAALQLRLGEGAAISFRRGEVCLRAQGGIRLVSDDIVGVVARSIHLMADDATLLIKSISLLTELFHVDAGRVRLFAGLLESTVRRLIRRASA